MCEGKEQGKTFVGFNICCLWMEDMRILQLHAPCLWMMSIAPRILLRRGHAGANTLRGYEGFENTEKGYEHPGACCDESLSRKRNMKGEAGPCRTVVITDET